MNLTPREKDKLLVAMAANVARRRLERGVKLNHPEAIALIADFVVEGARDGKSVADLMRDGAGVIGHVVIAAVYILVGALIGSQLVMARSAPVPIAEVRQSH